MRHIVLGTAGHIDHGKSTLVHALTGTDTDRLPDEKRRGITIDLGFARLPIGDDIELAIVDVPGHEAFIRNMLAGATGIDLVLLVVAADEGVMPQTREHLAIMNLLGISRGVVALTKADAAEPDWLELVREEVADLLQTSGLAAAPVLPVSARSGQGLGELRDALARAAADVPHRSADDLFRMPVDRVFSVHGTGTVATGTVWSGSLQLDQTVRIEPAGLTARVRGLQQHGAARDTVVAGARAAVAITGVDRQYVQRGESLLRGDGWAPSSILTVRMLVLPDAPAPVRPRQRVRVHVGTAEVLARVALLDRPLEPGADEIVQLRLEQPIVARAGDRAVIRSYSPVLTIAGSTIIEPHAPKRKRLDTATSDALQRVLHPHTALDAAVTLSGTHGVRIADLPILTGLRPGGVSSALATRTDLLAAGERVFDAAPVRACCDELLRIVASVHSAAPLDDGPEREAVRKALPPRIAGLFDLAVALLTDNGALVSAGSCLALSSHSPAPRTDQQAAIDVIASAFATAGLQAPDLADLPPAIAGRPDLLLLLRHLERTGILVRLGPDRWCDAAALGDGLARLHASLQAGESYPLSVYKEHLGLTRKHLIPLFEHFDRIGATRRVGELRVLTATGAVQAPAAGDA